MHPFDIKSTQYYISVGRHMVVSSPTHAPVDDRTRLSDRAFEAHHDPLAWEARPACMRAVRQDRTSCIEVYISFIVCFFLHTQTTRVNATRNMSKHNPIKKAFDVPWISYDCLVRLQHLSKCSAKMSIKNMI